MTSKTDTSSSGTLRYMVLLCTLPLPSCPRQRLWSPNQGMSGVDRGQGIRQVPSIPRYRGNPGPRTRPRVPCVAWVPGVCMYARLEPRGRRLNKCELLCHPAIHGTIRKPNENMLDCFTAKTGQTLRVLKFVIIRLSCCGRSQKHKVPTKGLRIGLRG